MTHLACAIGKPRRLSLEPGVPAMVAVSTVAGALGILFTAPARQSVELGALAALVFLGCNLLATAPLRHGASLTFSRAAMTLCGSVIAGATLAVLAPALGLPKMEPLELMIVVAAAASLSVAPPGTLRVPHGHRPRPKRVAVVGSALTASSLDVELQHAGIVEYEVVGRIGSDEARSVASDGVPDLGSLDGLAPILQSHRIDLLLLTADVPQLQVFEEVARFCLHLPVRVCQLSAFYESAFGHVAIAEINAAWFQYIMHPAFRSKEPPSKRVLDVLLALAVGVLMAPLVPLIALAVMSDGGPLLFRQVRIGQGGKPFTVLKFRTMRHEESGSVAWASDGDPRITRLGGLLRRTHLDELPQVMNVLRGNMSIVGPRPEQSEFVDRLERFVPFYQRRHLVRPGITGWAQVRCGYAGSDIGSAWKLCHDLFYLKHRSPSLDLVILVETVRMLFRNSHRLDQPRNVPFVLSTQPIDASEEAPVFAADAPSSAHG